MKKSTYYLALLTMVLLMAGACRKDKDLNPELPCGMEDPINELKWLNDQFKLFMGGPSINGIIFYRYENKAVIEVQNGLASSTNQHQYHCNGEKLNLDDPDDFARYKKNRKLIRVVYGTNLWNW
ncbi:hypothetical protein ACFPMF_12185 [Larkinella bovis]|uniref:Lipoprotein n=1 Tax=Larkinella bovis TaxID=683041 RepID=A0ABW0IC09_9BACT